MHGEIDCENNSSSLFVFPVSLALYTCNLVMPANDKMFTPAKMSLNRFQLFPKMGTSKKIL